VAAWPWYQHDSERGQLSDCAVSGESGPKKSEAVSEP